MPRKNNGHGGRRQGTPGVQYSNRQDLQAGQRAVQAPRAVPGQTYGQAGAQMEAQKAVPLPRQGLTPSGAAGSPGPSAGQPSGAPLPPMDAPTQRPGEPLTTGIPSGAGPGPEIFGQGGMSPVDEVRAMYAANPNDDMLRLLSYLDGASGPDSFAPPTKSFRFPPTPTVPVPQGAVKPLQRGASSLSGDQRAKLSTLQAKHKGDVTVSSEGGKTVFILPNGRRVDAGPPTESA